MNLNYCLNCGFGSPSTQKKCSQCDTVFGSVKIETKSESRAATVIIPESKSSKSNKFSKLPLNFDDENLESELDFDFSSLADEIEQQLNLSKNGSIKGSKSIKGKDLFKK